MAYEMKPLACDPTRIKGMSEKLIVSHYENNYGGVVRRLNAIAEQLAGLDFAAAPVFVVNGLKREELIAANSMILHEMFFASLGEESAPDGLVRAREPHRDAAGLVDRAADRFEPHRDLDVLGRDSVVNCQREAVIGAVLAGLRDRLLRRGGRVKHDFPRADRAFAGEREGEVGRRGSGLHAGDVDLGCPLLGLRGSGHENTSDEAPLASSGIVPSEWGGQQPHSPKAQVASQTPMGSFGPDAATGSRDYASLSLPLSGHSFPLPGCPGPTFSLRAWSCSSWLWLGGELKLPRVFGWPLNRACV
jgi:hypothetical protein